PVTIEKYGTGALCMHCHRSRRNAATYTEDPDNASSHYGAHHGPEADLLLGANAPIFEDKDGNIIEFPSSPHAVAVVPGETQGNACVNCHMAGELADAEGNINLVGGHSWNMNDTEGNDHVEACAPCHGIIGDSFKDKKYYVNGNADLDGNGIAEGLQVEIHGLMEELALLLPPVGEPEVSLNDTSLAIEIFKAGYVYLWIEEDRSFGVHNPAFAFSLLKAAIETVGGIVSVDFPESGVAIPQQYQLSQNYPNPFNPSTTIEYSLPEQANVSVTIYDALGNELEILFSGEETAGIHQVTWNASNYASGIYFYRMTSEKFVQVKKMLLLK
ncbi:MAG: T9SS type A sorting domain-containing protein, partial [Ignavibacteriaceae bacterium]